MSEQSIVDRLKDGWPVYAAVGVFLLGYSELWIDKKVSIAIAASATTPAAKLEGVQTSVGQNAAAIGINTSKLEGLEAGQVRIEGQLALLTQHALDN